MVTNPAQQYLARVEKNKGSREREVLGAFLKDLDNAVEKGYTGFIFPSWTKRSSGALLSASKERYPWLKLNFYGRDTDHMMPTVRLEVIDG